MAQINLKRKKRFRVQISISQGCWEKYNLNLQLAQTIGAEIDYSKEFESWFNRQNEQVQQELNRMQATMQEAKVPAGGDRHGRD